MKDKLQRLYGSLRKCSAQTGINYYRLSHIVNGYIEPKPDEIKILNITPAEIKIAKAKARASK